MNERDRLRKLWLRELRMELDLGFDDLKHGRSSPENENTLQEIEAEGQRKLDAFKAKKLA